MFRLKTDCPLCGQTPKAKSPTVEMQSCILPIGIALTLDTCACVGNECGLVATFWNRLTVEDPNGNKYIPRTSREIYNDAHAAMLRDARLFVVVYNAAVQS